MVDPARLDAVLGMLRTATIGDSPHAHQPNVQHLPARPANEYTRAGAEASSFQQCFAVPMAAGAGGDINPLNCCAFSETSLGLRPSSTSNENQRKRPPCRRRNHRSDQLRTLRRWFDQHMDDPYPNPREKSMLAREAGMEIKQIEHCTQPLADRPVPSACVTVTMHLSRFVCLARRVHESPQATLEQAFVSTAGHAWRRSSVTSGLWRSHVVNSMLTVYRI